AELVPVLDILEDRIAATASEFGDAESFDVLFACRLDFLFNLDFDRQTMSVPAATSLDMISSHRLKAGKEVLYGTGAYVMDTWQPIGSWGTFIEDEVAFRRRLVE